MVLPPRYLRYHAQEFGLALLGHFGRDVELFVLGLVDQDVVFKYTYPCLLSFGLEDSFLS